MIGREGDDLRLHEQRHDLEQARRYRQPDKADVHPAVEEVVDLIRHCRVDDGYLEPRHGFSELTDDRSGRNAGHEADTEEARRPRGLPGPALRRDGELKQLLGILAELLACRCQPRTLPVTVE
jgi:hypothetical protein